MSSSVTAERSTLHASRVFASPLGPLRLRASGMGVCAIGFSGDVPVNGAAPAAAVHLDQLCRELDEYFAGKRGVFSVPLDLQGSEFQVAVWRRLLEIPIGRTCSYGDVAKAMGNPASVRAVGLANGCNPVAIVVPCHRVIGSDGRLVGYGGELWRKQWLLQHESSHSHAPGLFTVERPPEAEVVVRGSGAAQA
jgi:methylated-DNA-[protein]-cysteine S-methyltransferase